MSLDATQQFQEEDYATPYHWFTDPATQKGRVYFGYLRLCIEAIAQYAKKQSKPVTDVAVLDIGCGDARFLGELEKQGFKHLTGIDYSARAITFAQSLLRIAEARVNSASEPLPFTDQSQEVITLIETLEHIEPSQIPSAIAEIKRILKPNGLFIVTVPSTHHPLTPGSKHYQHFTEASLRAALSPAFPFIDVQSQDRAGFDLRKLFYYLIDNRYWAIKPLVRWYNLHVWPAVFNSCPAGTGRRLIAQCRLSA